MKPSTVSPSNEPTLACFPRPTQFVASDGIYGTPTPGQWSVSAARNYPYPVPPGTTCRWCWITDDAPGTTNMSAPTALTTGNLGDTIDNVSGNPALTGATFWMRVFYPGNVPVDSARMWAQLSGA